MSRTARALGVLALLVLPACTQLPESGPVTPGSTQATVVPNRGVDFDPPSPEPGDPPEAIVQNFLVAMQARPLQTSVARQYLTRQSAESWQPDTTYVYSGYTARTLGDSVVIELAGAERIDARGTWRGTMSEQSSRITFPVVQEGGEWRIARTPDALFVRDFTLEQGFASAHIGWFDPAGTILTPEPVHVVSGESLATALVRCLLLGPPPSLRGVVATFLPQGLEVSSVPVANGEAEVRLEGALPQLDAADLNRMVAQLAFTLRQVPGIDTFRVVAGDQELSLPGRVSQFPVDRGGDFDPTGFLADQSIWGLSGSGRLLRGADDELSPVDVGGQASEGWRSVAVRPSGESAAGVSLDGTSASVTEVDRAEAPVRTFATGATDLLEPRWDALGHLWLVDRAPGGAIVMVAGKVSPRALRSPGLSGERVRSFLVSRDGSRVVAVVAGAQGDSVVMARVLRAPSGRVLGLTRAEPVDLGALGAIRIRDLAWKSVTTVSLVFSSSPEVSQVRTVSLDGSPDAEQTSVTTIRGDYGRLLGSPDASLPTYAVSRDEVVALDERSGLFRLGDALPATLGYAG